MDEVNEVAMNRNQMGNGHHFFLLKRQRFLFYQGYENVIWQKFREDKRPYIGLLVSQTISLILMNCVLLPVRLVSQFAVTRRYHTVKWNGLVVVPSDSFHIEFCLYCESWNKRPWDHRKKLNCNTSKALSNIESKSSRWLTIYSHFKHSL